MTMYKNQLKMYIKVFLTKNVILLRPLMTLASPFWGQVECGQDYVYKTLEMVK